MKTETIKTLARAGYAARGFIYVAVGVLAASAAWSSAQVSKGAKGAIDSIQNLPGGELLVLLIAVGLVGYSIWRLVQAIYDADNHGTDLEGTVVRAGLGVSAITHFLLALFAFSLALDWYSGHDDQSGSSDWAAWVLGLPFGKWLLALVGVTIAGVGVAHIIKAWDARFEKRFEMNAQEQKIITPISRFGLVSRGVVFGIVGGLTFVAALRYDPSSAASTADALTAIQSWPLGWLLLGVIALGLIAFGVYSIIEAFYRRVSPAS